MKKARVSLQPSEGLVFSAASRIYAAWITAGKVSEGEEREWMERATKQAIELADLVDRSLQSDTEMD